MEKLVNVAKAPQDYVETFSESHGDVVTAPEFPHDDVEKDAKSARGLVGGETFGDSVKTVTALAIIAKLSQPTSELYE